MFLYFRNGRGNERIIAECSDFDEVAVRINKFCSDRNYKSYYTRSWQEENGDWWYDVDSHSEFFIVRNAVTTDATE